MIRYSSVFPQAIPANTVGGQVQIDRIQSTGATNTLNRTPNKEVGRDGTIDYSAGVPNVAYTISQNDYNDIAIFRVLGGKTTGSVSLSDFRTPITDIVWYMVDDNGTALGTMWYPKLRCSGFSITASDPDSKIERSFDVVGEGAVAFQGNNKYLIAKTEIANTGELVSTDWSIVLNDPAPVESPVTADKYIYRVTRIRSGVATDLAEGSGTSQWEYVSGTTTLTVHNAVVGDYYKIFYTATTYGTGDYWTNNDVDPGAVQAYNISMWIGSGSNALTRVQSCTIDVTFERADVGEIGNKEKVVYGVNSNTVTLTLPRKLEDYVLDAILQGESTSFGEIDIQNYLSTIDFVMKVYTDSTKTTFAWGLKISNLSPTETSQNVEIDGYVDYGMTLESESMVISESESDLAF